MPSGIHEFASYAEAFALGLTDVYEDELKQHPRSYTAFLKESAAQHWYDTDWMVSGLGAMPEKGIGEAVSTDTILKSPTKQYTLTPYALGVVIEYEAIRWDLYGVFDGLAEELAKSAVDRYNIVGHSVLNNSFSAPSATYQIYNGDHICDTSHTRLDGGTWSNESSDSIGLSYLGIQQAKTDLAKLVNERGRYVMVTPKTLICSEDNRWIAETILKSEWRPDNANQNVNLLKNGMTVYASPYLSNANYWWIQCDKGMVRMKMRLGDKPTLSKDNDIRTRNILMHSYCSFGLGIFDSKGLWGSLGS